MSLPPDPPISTQLLGRPRLLCREGRLVEAMLRAETLLSDDIVIPYYRHAYCDSYCGRINLQA